MPFNNKIIENYKTVLENKVKLNNSKYINFDESIFINKIIEIVIYLFWSI